MLFFLTSNCQLETFFLNALVTLEKKENFSSRTIRFSSVRFCSFTNGQSNEITIIVIFLTIRLISSSLFIVV